MTFQCRLNSELEIFTGVWSSRSIVPSTYTYTCFLVSDATFEGLRPRRHKTRRRLDETSSQGFQQYEQKACELNISKHRRNMRSASTHQKPPSISVIPVLGLHVTRTRPTQTLRKNCWITHSHWPYTFIVKLLAFWFSFYYRILNNFNLKM